MSSTWYFLAILAAILGSFIGPSQSTVIPLTNQPLTSSQSFSAAAAVHSQAHAPSVGNSRSNVNPFPAHDPFGRAKVYPGMVPHYPQENGGGQKRQTLQFTFSPEPQQQQQQQPLPIIKAVYTPPEALLPGPGGAPAADRSQMIINPADIQWTAPDVPDAISSEIINKIRLQLGNGPVTLGELNHRLIQFTTTLPNVLVNKTQITTVQETVVEEQKQVQQEDQKSTRMMAYQQQQQQPKKPVSASYKVTTSSSTSTSGYDGHPSKTYVSYDKVAPINSLSYNPAAAAVYDSSRAAVPPYAMAGNDYQKSYSEQQYSYQVPSDSSYQTNYYQPQSQPQPQPSYSKPEVSYSSKPPPQPQQPAYQADSAYQQAPPPPPAAAYQKAPEPAYASKPQQQQYQPPPPPPKAADYQKPKAEAYQQQQPPPPKESYSAPPPPHHQQHKKQQSYTSPPPPPPPPKEENVKIIYKYVEVCNPSSYEKLQPQSPSPPPPPPPQPSYKPQPQQSKPQYPNQQGQQKPNPYVEVAGSLASQYPNSGEPLNLDLASTTSEAAGSAQDSQAALASVYGEIHRRMAELEQLQRYVASVQAEVQQAYTPIVIPQIYVPPMPTLSYSSVGPSYLEPQVPSTYYSPVPASNYPPPPPPPPPKPAAVSYSPPPPKQQEYKPQQQPSYSTPKPQPSYNTPKPSYSEPKNQPQQSYNSGQPYNGNQMTVQYVKTVEKVSQNATSPAAAAAY